MRIFFLFFIFFEKEDFSSVFEKKRTTHDQVHRPIEKWPLERACITGLVTLGRKDTQISFQGVMHVLLTLWFPQYVFAG